MDGRQVPGTGEELDHETTKNEIAKGTGTVAASGSRFRDDLSTDSPPQFVARPQPSFASLFLLGKSH